MTVEIKTIKGGYSSFLVKLTITREFFENQRVLFDHYIHKFWSHVNFAYTRKIRLLKWLLSQPKIHTREIKSVISDP